MAAQYINFFTDFGFKKLFGTEVNKDLLIDFLNELLRGQEKPIRDLTYTNPARLGSTEIDRKAIFDLYCVTEDGEKFIVELQKAKQKFFKDRSLFYATFPIQEQAISGNDWNFELKAVYTVAILDFVFDEDKDDPEKFHYVVKLADQETNRVFYDKLTFVYLEMPKFTKTEAQLVTHFDKWLYAIRNLGNLDHRPAALQERIFQKFFEKAKIANLAVEDRKSYEASLKYYRDLNNVIDTAREEAAVQALQIGLQKGEEIGLEKGEQIGLEKGEQIGLEKGREEGQHMGIRIAFDRLVASGVPELEARKMLGLLPPE